MAKKTRIGFLIWSAYLLADWVAAVALRDGCKLLLAANASSDDDNDENLINELVPPFLVPYLGGSDNITAYALEDNELWLRYLAGLVIQTGLASYILLVSLPGSSWLPMLCTLALGSANIDRLDAHMPFISRLQLCQIHGGVNFEDSCIWRQMMLENFQFKLIILILLMRKKLIVEANDMFEKF